MADGTGQRSQNELLTWSKGLAPRYIALFLLLVYCDQLAPRTLAVSGMGPALLGVVVAALACYLLFFRPVAMRGLASRQTIEGLGESAFGTVGSRVFVNAVLALCQVVWFAVALHYATSLSFRALIAFGLLAARHIEPVWWHGTLFPGPLYLWVVAAWSIASALIGTLAFRLVAAVMAGYQAFPALVLALVAVWAIPSARGFQPLGFDPTNTEAPWNAQWYSCLWMVQLVCGFFATHAALGADWGKASRDAKDVSRGGWVGVTLAAVVFAVLGLLIVAGANGRDPALGHLAPAIEAQQRYRDLLRDPPNATSVEAERHLALQSGWLNFTVQEAIASGIGGSAAGIALILLGMAFLGPACFTPYMFARFVQGIAPGLPRWGLTLLAAVLAWPLLVWRLPARLDLVFTLLGGAAAPICAVIAADAWHSRGAWLGPRPGLNLAGTLAWLLGALVGWTPLVGPVLGGSEAEYLQPAVIYSYVVAFVFYSIAARLGLVSRGANR